MFEETEALSSELGASKEVSTEIIQPRVPEPTTNELVRGALWNLAQSNPDAIEEDLALRKISKAYRVGLNPLKAMYPSIKAACEEASKPAPPPPTVEEIVAEERRLAAEIAERNAVGLEVGRLQQTSDLHPEFHDQLIKAGFICESLLASTILLSHGARLLRRSSAFFITGASSSGKTDGVHKGAQFLPPEAVLSLTSVSDQALYYLGDIKHLYLMFGEISPRVDEQDDFRQTAMRQLISENQITRIVVEKPDGKSNVAVMKKTEGPCVVVATTTKEPNKFNDELQNRASWVQSNDSPEVTRRVLAAIAQRAEDPTIVDDYRHTLTKKAFQEFHRTLAPLMVSVPFARKIMPTSKDVTVRRLSNLILDYVRANALLHQHSRQRIEVNGQQVVVASLDDYSLAYRVATANAPRVLELCPPKARKAFDEILRPEFERGKTQGWFMLNTGQIQQIIREPDSTVRRWLGDYVKAGLLSIVPGMGGRQNTYALNEDAGHVMQDLGLVPPAQVEAALSAPQPIVAQFNFAPTDALTWEDVL